MDELDTTTSIPRFSYRFIQPQASEFELNPSQDSDLNVENGSSDEMYPGLEPFSDLGELMEKARKRRVSPYTREYRHQYRDKYSNWYYYRNP